MFAERFGIQTYATWFVPHLSSSKSFIFMFTDRSVWYVLYIIYELDHCNQNRTKMQV